MSKAPTRSPIPKGLTPVADLFLRDTPRGRKLRDALALNMKVTILCDNEEVLASYLKIAKAANAPDRVSFAVTPPHRQR